MQNKLSDLNNHLFAQIERLSDEDLTPEQIQTEVRRADAICDISEQIIKSAALQLSAVKLVAEHGNEFLPRLPMIEGVRDAQG